MFEPSAYLLAEQVSVQVELSKYLFTEDYTQEVHSDALEQFKQGETQIVQAKLLL